MNHHSITVLGKCGRDPEMRYTPSGQAVTSFSVAVNRTYKQGDETIKETMWFRVSAWGKLAEICKQYISKGATVYIIGRLTPDKTTGGPRVWTNKAGESQASFEIVANEIQFDGGKKYTADDNISDNDASDEKEIPF